jgi:hypothetical protein
MSKSYLRRNKIAGQFAWQLIEMLESPAYRALSRAARQILARLEIELAHHGGRDNGKLIVTFAQFEEYGIEKHAIGPAIRELVALGFVEITRYGRAGNGEFRIASMYRLTYRPVDRAKPTDEWRNIQTIEQAEQAAQSARGPRQRAKRKREKTATCRLMSI